MNLMIPHPLQVELTAEKFLLTPETRISGTPAFVKHFQNYFGPATGYRFAAGPADRNVVRATIDQRLRDKPAGAYVLSVTADAIDIAAAGEPGLFYALQTLRQLAPADLFSTTIVHGTAWEIVGARIEDAPRFQWRGVMLDCSRHFFSVDYIKQFIDRLAMHKFNVFHWHFTDDQGWRVEIRKYPKLAEVGGWREGTVIGHSKEKPPRFDGVRYGGFYTQDQMRDIVAYAAERHVTVVPEIEMPGHSRAAIAAYPELGNTAEPWPVSMIWGIEPHILNAEESTIRFYQDVLEEVLDIFPSTFIHIGGDEAIKDEWKASPRAQERIRELGLKDEHDLQAWMIKQIDQYLTAKGRRLIGWDEILEGELAAGATVMSWRGAKGGIAAARMGHDVVMSRSDHTYLDSYQSSNRMTEPLAIHGLVTLEKAYQFEPIPEELTPEEGTRILGGQAQLWSEYIPNPDRLHYMMYPRALAIAESLWSAPARRDYTDFRRRVPHHLRCLQRLGVHGRPLD